MSFVTKENTQDIYPLSPTQKGMLFHSVLDDSTPVYFEQLAFTINGPLDIDAFRGAWDHLIAVTPVFRTVFKWKKVKEPIQIVLKQLPVNLNVHDVTHLDKDIQEERIREFLEDDKNTPLHFEEGPLIRLNIFKLGQEVNHFIWSHHHLIIDGWCLPIILQDMFNNYMSLIAKSPLPVPSRRPYRDYISWYLKKDAAIAMDFWKSKIGDVDSPTPLPIDRMPGKSSHVEVAEEKLLLSEEMTEKLQTLSKNERITQSALMQAVWSLLLSRYSGRDDVLTGIVVSGRPVDLKGSEEMIGLFINTLPVRVTFTHDMTVSELLQSVQDFTLAIRDYEYSLLLDVKTCSAIPTIQNLFDSIVVFENYPVENLTMGQDVGFSITNANGFEMTNFPLTVLIAPGPQMSINIQYYKELFNKETIDQILGHMHQVLSTIVENSQIKLSELDILTSQEREKILVSFNDTVSPFPKDKCPYQLFEKQVEKTPERTAIFFEEKTISYKTLNEKANQLARFLRKKGVGNDDKVGLLVERSFDMIIGILGIHKAGGAYVPMDPEYPKARLEYTLDDSESPVLVTQSTLLEGLSKYPENVVLLDTHWDEIAKENQENLQPSVNPENLSHLIYTSGSTGLPKGVMLEHGNVTAFLFWALDEFTYDEYEEMIASTSMCFDLSVFEFFLPLITGAKIVLLHSSLDIDGYLETHTATMINTVPSALKHLLSVMKNRHRIKAINLAGEPLKLDLVQHAYAHLDVDIIRNLYGPTEDTTYSTGYRIPRDIDRQPLIGKPIANTRAYILDNYLKPVPVGMLGEIYLAGTNLARGYWKAPEKTKERFIPNPYSQDAYPYLYKTGDLGKWQPDGNIEFHGRVDYQVKIRGNRIEMGEIETRLSEHENIRDTAVIDKDDTEGNKFLMAYYVSDSEISTSDLRAFLSETLPDYMVPSRFILLEKMPLTPNGKVDKNALPDADGIRPMIEAEYVAPRNEVEKVLAKIWMEVLEIDKVGINDNFFDLGGHSLRVMKVMAMLKLQYPLTVQDFFEYQTIAELSMIISERASSDNDSGPQALTEEENERRISVDISISGKQEHPKNILLSGATGYLGSYLLKEFMDSTDAKIYCLIRGENQEEITGKLMSSIHFYFGQDVVNMSRVVPVLGDVGKDGLGMDGATIDNIKTNVDTFVHAAADVRHYGEYDHFENINVIGTKRLLDLAFSGNCKRFHYISTLSISGDYIPKMAKAIFAETDYDRGQVLSNVYAKSKFEAEAHVRRAMEKGLDTTIFRVGNLVGTSENGMFQRSIETSAFYGFIKAIAHIGVIPEGIENQMDMTPVDVCSNAIATLMLFPETSGQTLHIYNPNLITLGGLSRKFQNLGFKIQTLPMLEYLDKLQHYQVNGNDDALEKLIPLFAGSTGQHTKVVYNNAIAQHFLNESGFSWPALDEELMGKLMDYCVSVGFIRNPEKNT